MVKQLKQGWRWVRLGDIATEHTERGNPSDSNYDRFVGSNHIGRFDLKVCNWGSTEDVSSEMKVFQPGDYLFVRRSLYASDFRERAARVDFSGLCSGDILTIREKRDVITDGFLAVVLNHPGIWEYVVATATGSITRRVKWKQLADFKFALPPMEEQRRMAELIWAADDTLQEYEHLKQENRKIRSSIRKHFFTYGNRGIPTRDSIVGQIPTNWNVNQLGIVFEFLDNMRIPLKDSERNKKHGDYPYYGAVGIIDYVNNFIFEETTLLLEEDGMNLISRSSPVVFKATGKYWVNNHAHVLRPCGQANIDFYAEYLEYISFEPYVTGTYQKKITKSDAMAIPVIFPPIDEQIEIAKKFNLIHETEYAINNQIESTRKLKKQLMSSLMGE